MMTIKNNVAKQDAGVRNQGFLTINFLQEVSTEWDAGIIKTRRRFL